jgi:hypothetical protein
MAANTLVTLEELHGALVLLRCGATLESPQVAPLTGFRIFLARVEPILAGRQFSNHRVSVGRWPQHNIAAMRQRFLGFYALFIVLIAASFVWQMIHGLCPVP